jgi:hypothetical protein
MDLSFNVTANLIDDFTQKKEEETTVTIEKNDEKPLQNRFLLSAKNLFLTYSSCYLDLTVIIELLKVRLSSYIVKDYVLVREIDKTTGKSDIYAYLKLAKKANIFSESFLDLHFENNIYHGHYQTAKQPNIMIESMLKSVRSKYDKNLLFSTTMDQVIDKLGEFKNFYSSLIELAEQGKIDEAMLLLKRINPELYITQGKTIETRLKEILEMNNKNLI